MIETIGILFDCLYCDFDLKEIHVSIHMPHCAPLDLLTKESLEK